MTTSVKFSLKGLDEYMEAIVSAGQDVDAAADSAISAGANILESGMKSRAPVLTGNLRDHIKQTGALRDGNYHWREIGLIHSRKMTDADTARYGNVQEYGSANTPAHPYARPTISADTGKARRKMKDVLKSLGMIPGAK